MTLSNPSPQLRAVLQFYDAITTWKFDAIEELFSEDYVHTTLPSSAKEPPKSKAQGLAHAKGVAAALGYTPLKVACRILSRHIAFMMVVLRHSTRSFD